MTDTTAAPAAQAPASEEIGDILRQQFDKTPDATAPARPTVLSDAAAPAPEPAPDGRARGPDGKFIPKEAPVEGVQPAVIPAEAPLAPVVGKPPPGWAHGPEKWNALDATGREFIAKREADYNRGIQMHSQMAGFGNTMMQEFMPYEGLIRSVGATPQQAARFLLNSYATLTAGTPQQKAQFISQLAQENGVDLGGIVTNGVPAIDPEVQALKQRYYELANAFSSQQSQRQQAETTEIHSVIDAFASDPAHPHFERARPTMAVLLQGGQAKDLQEAYDSACWTVPEIRASLISQRQAQESEKRKKEAEAAQRAGVSLTGAPTATVKDLGDMSLRDNIASQMGIAGRV